MALPKDTRATLLARMVQEKDWRIGAELGVLDGKTFRHLLKQCPKLNLVGVDTWTPWPEKESEAGGRSYSDHDLEAYYRDLRNTVETRYSGRGVLLRKTTTEAARHFPDRHFDFVFIDADHTYEGVSADIDTWLPKVREGGLLMGHDYNWKRFPGVVQAVSERFTPTLHADHVWSVPC